jgi:hypothetical protein
MNNPLKYNDRVVVTVETYCCADVGEIGTIVDEGYLVDNNLYRYLVRWDNNPTMLYGVHSCDIKQVIE